MLLTNSAAITSFRRPLEALQRLLYVYLEGVGAKSFDHPTQPAWWEGEVSAKLYKTGSSVNWCACDGDIVDHAKGNHHMQLDLVLFRIYTLYSKRHTLRSTESGCFQIAHLSGRGLSIGHDALCTCVPPLIVEFWLHE